MRYHLLSSFEKPLHRIQRPGRGGPRNMKSMWPPLAAIFLWLVCTGLGRGHGPLGTPPGSTTDYRQIFRRLFQNKKRNFDSKKNNDTCCSGVTSFLGFLIRWGLNDPPPLPVTIITDTLSRWDSYSQNGTRLPVIRIPSAILPWKPAPASSKTCNVFTCMVLT